MGKKENHLGYINESLLLWAREHYPRGALRTQVRMSKLYYCWGEAGCLCITLIPGRWTASSGYEFSGTSCLWTGPIMLPLPGKTLLGETQKATGRPGTTCQGPLGRVGIPDTMESAYVTV